MKKLTSFGRLDVLLIITLLIPVFLTQKAVAAWETDIDRQGMDLKSFWIDKDIEAFVAVKQCEDACKKDPQCKAFTFVKSGVQGVHGRCYIKKGIPSPINNTCCISGVVRPETDTDRCKNYSATALQQNQSNIDWKCSYSGLRWSSNYKAHYDWCMKVPKSSADSEETIRKDLLKNCWQPSTSGDLSAYGWCYEINKEQNEIAFSPVIKNEGKNIWKSKKEGYYTVGVWGPFGIIEKKDILPHFPNWYLEANSTSILEGLTLSFHPDNLYGVENLWILNHPEDTNISNNSNPGLKGFYKGTSFITNPYLVPNMCKYYEAKEFMKPIFGLKPVIGKRNVLAILWDPQRATDPAPTKNLIENAIFGLKSSVRDYFWENSGGLFTIENAGVLGWYKADKPAVHYWGTCRQPFDQEDLSEDRNNNCALDPGEDLNNNNIWDGPDGSLQPDEDINKNGKLDFDLDGDGWIHGHTEKWAEAVRKTEKSYDFKKYDINNDGILSPDELTILIVIPQNKPFGTQRNSKGKEFPDKDLIVDGVKINKVVEAYIGSPPSIGLVAHELSHILLEAGDMYFNFFQPYAAGPYSLMDQSPPNPPHLDPFHKLKLAWIVPKIINFSGWYEIPDIETSHEAYILYDPNRGNKEYYIIENRRPGISYDMAIPSSGLAIWHIIEESKVFNALPTPPGVDQDLWNDPRWQGWARKGIRMIRPIYGPPVDNSLWDGSNPKTSYDLLSIDPDPNHVTLRWADGTSSGFAIRSIPPSSSVMKVKIEVE